MKRSKNDVGIYKKAEGRYEAYLYAGGNMLYLGCAPKKKMARELRGFAKDLYSNGVSFAKIVEKTKETANNWR